MMSQSNNKVMGMNYQPIKSGHLKWVNSGVDRLCYVDSGQYAVSFASCGKVQAYKTHRRTRGLVSYLGLIQWLQTSLRAFTFLPTSIRSNKASHSVFS